MIRSSRTRDLYHEALPIAVGVLIVLTTPLTLGGTWGIVGFLGAVARGLVGITILLRIGLLALVVALISDQTLSHLRLSLDANSWYFGSSVVILLLVTAMAAGGFIVSLGGHPAFGTKARS